MSKIKVLLTGATGFVGSYIARHLIAQNQYEIFATKRENSNFNLLGKDSDSITWLTGDLDNYFFVEDCILKADVVIHIAGLVSYDKKDKKALFRQNTLCTRHVVNACLEAKIDQLIYMSSIAAISPANPTEPVSEKSLSFFKTKNSTDYSKSKYRAELEVWRGIEEGLSACIINPSVVIGAGTWNHSSCKLFKWVAKQQKHYPTGTTGFVDVRDVARFVQLCIENKTEKERFILNAANWSYKQLFDTIAKYLDVTPPQKAVNTVEAEIAWRLASVKAILTNQKSLLTKATARRSMEQNTYLNKKSLSAGFEYRRLETTIEETAKIYLATKEKGYGTLPI